MKLYFKLGFLSLVVLSNLSADKLVTSADIKQMEAFQKASIERQKQQEMFKYIEESEYESTALYSKAEEDMKWVENVMNNFDHFVNLNVIAEYEKKINKMKKHKNSAYLVKKIRQLEELVNSKKNELKLNKGINNEK